MVDFQSARHNLHVVFGSGDFGADGGLQDVVEPNESQNADNDDDDQKFYQSKTGRSVRLDRIPAMQSVSSQRSRLSVHKKKGAGVRLQKTGDKYEFDLWFYALALGLLVAVGGAFWYGQKLIAQSNGRKIQALITKTNLSSPEYFQKMAKSWMDGPAIYHKLTPDQRKAAEAILARGMEERRRLWHGMMMESIKQEEIKRRQKTHWNGVMNELNTYLRSIGKKA